MTKQTVLEYYQKWGTCWHGCPSPEQICFKCGRCPNCGHAPGSTCGEFSPVPKAKPKT